MEDQKRRTMEALERRFAQAKSELQTQQQKSKKRSIEDNERVASNIQSPPADSTDKKSFSNSSSRKGNFSFSGHTSKKDVEVNEPAYLKLSHFVHENLLPTGFQVSDTKLTVDRVLHELFQHGDSAQKYMQGSKTMKIEHTILLDNFVPKGGMSTGGRIRALKNGSKRSRKHMSLKQHKRSGSFSLPKEFHNFEIFKPMHEKWKSYVQQLLKIVGKDQLAQCFLNADLHGAILLVRFKGFSSEILANIGDISKIPHGELHESVVQCYKRDSVVVQCKIADYVGIHGIMVRETMETFGIITQDNKFRVVPKKFSVFMLQADCWKITLHGDKLASRNLVP